MPENQNPEVNQPTDELNDEQLGEVAGGGGPQQGLILPYIEQDNAKQQPADAQPSESLSINFTKIEYKYIP
jgi:hypothetical protein